MPEWTHIVGFVLVILFMIVKISCNKEIWKSIAKLESRPHQPATRARSYAARNGSILPLKGLEGQ